VGKKTCRFQFLLLDYRPLLAPQLFFFDSLYSKSTLPCPPIPSPPFHCVYFSLFSPPCCRFSQPCGDFFLCSLRFDFPEDNIVPLGSVSALCCLHHFVVDLSYLLKLRVSRSSLFLFFFTSIILPSPLCFFCIASLVALRCACYI